ncbi:hypothetical protein M569_02698, partial [Genlisea aurea]
MAADPTDASMPDACSGFSSLYRNLRGLKWRIDLGILPSSASIDDLRRATADSRRRYASSRRKLLIDPRLAKDGINSADLTMDNPLSQNPGSMWGQFFRNAELERTLDQDLMRLYPERGSYFQTSGCQGMLRRILLLWCLGHVDFGYRQGMHELLAPLLYVLQTDVERLFEVRKAYEDHFADEFENDPTYKFDLKKFGNSCATPGSDPEILQMMVSLTDAYGAEGELGVVLSDKFMEHDAYSMFDALLSGSGGPVSMTELFDPSPSIKACGAIYRLLSVADASLYGHLVELGIEPQYFGLRWLRVLFGREFDLEDLLIIWDEIFSHQNVSFYRAAAIVEEGEEEEEEEEGISGSPRGLFICFFAVSMILNLRSQLLSTEIPTAALQRLLNYPSSDIKIERLLEKAKSMMAAATSQLRSGGSASEGTTPVKVVAAAAGVSYWEEKWREKQKEKENTTMRSMKGWSQRVLRLQLSRTISDPSPSRTDDERVGIREPSVRRSLLKDLEQQLDDDEE